MSSALIEHNRRAVYSALSAVCSERSLLEQAFSLWEDHYSELGTFRVSQYIDALMQHIGLNQTQRRELSVALYAALGKPDSALATVPSVLRRNPVSIPPVARAAQLVAAKPPAGQSPATIVFGELLSQLVDGATRARKLEELLELLDFSSCEVGASSTRAATHWAATQLREARSVAGQIAEADRRTVVNVVYMALCEALGPAGADRILSHAVQQAERVPEAIQFSPRQLL
jgi:hypothetical protein